MMRNKLIYIISMVALLGFSNASMAATPLIFQQTNLTLIAYGPAPNAPTSITNEQGETVPAPAPAPRAFKLRAQMRPASALQQKDLFSVDPFAKANAHLFVFDPATLTAFSAPSIQKAVDLLAVNADGTILEIVAKAVPATLDASQYSVEQPVRALLLLPAGTVDANGLRPGDKVQHALFNQLPEKRR